MRRYILLLLAVLLTGAALQAQQKTAGIQIFHASADPDIPAIDLWLDNTLLIENFKLGDATPIIEIPADSTLFINCYLAGTSPDIFPFMGTNVRVNEGETWMVMLTGLVNESEFVRNPDGWYTFFIFRNSLILRDEALSPNVTDLMFFNTVTDSPGLDIYDETNAELLKDVQYCWQKDYVSVMPKQKTFTLRNNRNPQEVIGTYSMDLKDNAGQTAFIFMTGFLEPALNQDGPALKLQAVYPDGSVEQLSNVTSVDNPATPRESTVEIYPMPVRSAATVSFSLDRTAPVTLLLYNNAGIQVYSESLGRHAPGTYSVPLQSASLPSGIYRATVQMGGVQESRHFMVVR